MQSTLSTIHSLTVHDHLAGDRAPESCCSPEQPHPIEIDWPTDGLVHYIVCEAKYTTRPAT